MLVNIFFLTFDVLFLTFDVLFLTFDVLFLTFQSIFSNDFNKLHPPKIIKILK